MILKHPGPDGGLGLSLGFSPTLAGYIPAIFEALRRDHFNGAVIFCALVRGSKLEFQDPSIKPKRPVRQSVRF